jgi:predicted transposase YdaD
LFLFRHLARLDAPPPPLQEEVFEELFEVTEIANFPPDERRGYQASLKAYRDWYSIEMTARQEALETGREEGRERGREEEAIALITRQLTRRLKQELPEEVKLRFSTLPRPVLEDLSEALLDFTTLAELETWLAQQKDN